MPLPFAASPEGVREGRRVTLGRHGSERPWRRRRPCNLSRLTTTRGATAPAAESPRKRARRSAPVQLYRIRPRRPRTPRRQSRHRDQRAGPGVPARTGRAYNRLDRKQNAGPRGPDHCRGEVQAQTASVPAVPAGPRASAPARRLSNGAPSGVMTWVAAASAATGCASRAARSRPPRRRRFLTAASRPRVEGPRRRRRRGQHRARPEWPEVVVGARVGVPSVPRAPPPRVIHAGLTAPRPRPAGAFSSSRNPLRSQYRRTP